MPISMSLFCTTFKICSSKINAAIPQIQQEIRKNEKSKKRNCTYLECYTLHRLLSSVNLTEHLTKARPLQESSLTFEAGSMKSQLPTPLTHQLSTSQLIITSTMALGSSSARKSCSMASMMFFQPSRRMSPWRWAK